MQEVNTKACQKNKREKKRKYQRNRYHMNIDLNERLKQYQRHFF